MATITYNFPQAIVDLGVDGGVYKIVKLTEKFHDIPWVGNPTNGSPLPASITFTASNGNFVDLYVALYNDTTGNLLSTRLYIDNNVVSNFNLQPC